MTATDLLGKRVLVTRNFQGHEDKFVGVVRAVELRDAECAMLIEVGPRGAGAYYPNSQPGTLLTISTIAETVRALADHEEP